MSRATTYNLDQVICTIGGVPISGYGSGGAIKIEAAEDAVISVVGNDGEIVFCRSGNKLRKITITLLQTSLANVVCSAAHTAMQLAPNGILFPFAILDTGGNSLFVSSAACFAKIADQEFAKEAKDREWPILAIADVEFVGNN